MNLVEKILIEPDRRDIRWEGRTVLYNPRKMVPSRSGAKNVFSVLSYHIFADFKANLCSHTTTKSWDYRSVMILEEIKSYDPDILCLQDVDHFQDWWRPQLMLLGYSSFYQQRTQLKDFHYEGSTH